MEVWNVLSCSIEQLCLKTTLNCGQSFRYFYQNCVIFIILSLYGTFQCGFSNSLLTSLLNCIAKINSILIRKSICQYKYQ